MPLQPCQHQPQIPSFFLHNSVPSSGSPPSRRSVFPASDPWPLPLLQEMANMPQKADGSVGLAEFHIATPPYPAPSTSGGGVLFPHDTDTARGHAVPYITYHKYLGKNYISVFINLQMMNYIGLLCKKLCRTQRPSQFIENKYILEGRKLMNSQLYASLVLESCFLTLGLQFSAFFVQIFTLLCLEG